MALKLVIDSSADLTHADVDENVEILPIPVFIDGKEYLPFINLTNEDFYRLQKEAKELPKTVQVPFNLLYKTFKEELLKGNEVVAIFIASKLSGTYSSACAVREQLVDEIGEEVREKLFIIDSLTVTYPLGALCLEAYKMLKNGSTAKEIFERINYLVPRLK
ncbi:MAG: DegV family protein, partial [Bacilli bacterium]|nr:DegV family protein [Bacilli bacterium]